MTKVKEFSKFFIASLKRTAQNVAPLVRRKNKMYEEIAAKQAELERVEAEIEGYQVPIKIATGGYTTEDLVERTVVETGKLDKEGRPIKQTQYNLKYPETVIPTEEHAEVAVDEPTIEDIAVPSNDDDLPFMTQDVMNPSNDI